MNNADRAPNIQFLILLTVLCVLICRMLIIHEYGSDVPFWDQWDAEGWQLYKPWLEGNLKGSTLFAAHNEHRIFVTRVWNLFIFEVNGAVWSPKLQMMLNQLWFALAYYLFLKFVWPPVGSNYEWLFILPAVFLAASPFAWENTIAGFQSQFYFMQLFGLLGLWMTFWYRSWGSLLAAFLFFILSFFSLASGVVVGAAAALGLIFAAVLERRVTARAMAGILGSLAFVVMAIIATPEVEGHSQLKPSGLFEFGWAWLMGLSWPTIPMLKVPGLWLSCLPCIVFSLHLLRAHRGRTTVPREDVLLVVLGGWVIGQIAVFALGRGEGLLASRYMDVYAMGLLVNIAVALKLFGYWALFGRYALLIWSIPLVLSLIPWTATAFRFMEQRLAFTAEHEKRVLAYVCDRDEASVIEAPFLAIPYPDGQRLKRLLDDPTIFGILKFVPSNCR